MAQSVDSLAPESIAPVPPFTPPESAPARGFSAALLNSLLQFKDGQFSTRMPTDIGGIEGKIADVLN